MRSGRSESGLSFAVKSSVSKVAYCSLSVRCGNRAEGDLPQGTAHFVEHTIFKGTKHFSASRINSYLDRLGGELNAYTTKEEIVLHATVLREDIWKAVGLLLEIATRATFPEHEIETERGVIIDEIISYKDSPSDDIFDTFESRFFEGSPLGRLILGTVESVGSITVEDLKAYYRRNFIPSNMALCIVASGDEEKLERQMLALAGKYITPGEDQMVIPGEDRVSSSRHFDITEDKHNHEANALLGVEAPSLYNPDSERVTAALLTNILGGPSSNSMLGAYLREKHGWVYSIECAYAQFRETGMITISLGCEKENLAKCLRAVERILAKICSTPLSEAKLKAAKKQLLGQLAISGEGGETQCLSMGKSMISFGKIMKDEQTRALIDAITAEDLHKMAVRTFSPGKVSKLVYL